MLIELIYVYKILIFNEFVIFNDQIKIIEADAYWKKSCVEYNKFYDFSNVWLYKGNFHIRILETDHVWQDTFIFLFEKWNFRYRTMWIGNMFPYYEIAFSFHNIRLEYNLILKIKLLFFHPELFRGFKNKNVIFSVYWIHIFLYSKINYYRMILVFWKILSRCDIIFTHSYVFWYCALSRTIHSKPNDT